MASVSGRKLLVRLWARNFLGIKDELELTELGQLTTIQGPVGVGKSSILQAIAVALGGSRKDTTLLHQGTEEGEVGLQLDDGTVISRPISAEGAGSAKVRDGKLGVQIRSPERYIAELCDRLSFDPVAFLSSKGKERIQLLIEALPVKGEFSKLPAFAQERAPGRSGDYLNLEQLDLTRERVYEDRRNIGVALTQQRKTLESLEGSIPPVPHANPQEIIQGLRARRQEIDHKLSLDIREFEREQDEETHAAKLALQREQEEIRRKAEERCHELEMKFRDVEAGRLKAVRDYIAEANEEVNPKLAELDKTISVMEHQIEENAKAQGLRDLHEETAERVEDLAAQHQEAQEAIDAIDAMKTQLLSESRLPGVRIEGGDLFVKDGEGRYIHFDKLNTGNRIRFAIELAMLRAGTLPAILVDELGRLDADTREEFLQEISKREEIQFVVAWADVGALKIRSGGGKKTGG